MTANSKPLKPLSDDLFFVRGVSIMLVVLVHVLGVEGHQGVRGLFQPELPALRFTAEFIHTFNMAVMLIGSGVAWRAFGRPDSSLRTFFEKRLKKLVLPLLLWLPALMLVEAFTKGYAPTFAGVFGGLLDPDQASIFWFIHALLWCTFLAFVLRRFLPRVELIFPLALSAHLICRRLAPDSYADFALYWFCYFAFGTLLQPAVPAIRGWLVASNRRALLSFAGLVTVLLGLYHFAPDPDYQRVRPLAGPIGFLMQLTLAVLLGDLLKRASTASARARAFVVQCGSVSMALYVFHIYFVSGSRMAMLRFLHTHSVPVHLAIGWSLGFFGPWLLWHTLRNNRLFLMTVGLAPDQKRPQPAPLQRLAA
jgi:fucose 4-O-acetylase-like acetyltransferase